MPNEYGQETRYEKLKRRGINSLRSEYHMTHMCALCELETVKEWQTRHDDNFRPCEICGDTTKSATEEAGASTPA